MYGRNKVIKWRVFSILKIELAEVLQILIQINTIVNISDDHNFNGYNPMLQNDEQMKFNTPYKIIDVETEENENLYTLLNLNNNTICGVMVNDWEIEKAEVL